MALVRMRIAEFVGCDTPSLLHLGMVSPRWRWTVHDVVRELSADDAELLIHRTFHKEQPQHVDYASRLEGVSARACTMCLEDFFRNDYSDNVVDAWIHIVRKAKRFLTDARVARALRWLTDRSEAVCNQRTDVLVEDAHILATKRFFVSVAVIYGLLMDTVQRSKVCAENMWDCILLTGARHDAASMFSSDHWSHSESRNASALLETVVRARACDTLCAMAANGNLERCAMFVSVETLCACLRASMECGDHAWALLVLRMLPGQRLRQPAVRRWFEATVRDTMPSAERARRFLDEAFPSTSQLKRPRTTN